MATFNQSQFLSYCQSLYEADKSYDAMQANRLDRHRHVEPDAAQFLASVVMMKNPRKVLEIGTSTGFSTLWLAYGLRHQSGAQFISLDIDKHRSQTAKKHLQAVGLEALVELQVQDALVFLQQNHQPFDMIFLDAERQYYATYTEYLHHSLSMGSVLIVDNVISHSAQVETFLAAFKTDSRYLCHTLDIGAGLFLAVRQES